MRGVVFGIVWLIWSAGAAGQELCIENTSVLLPEETLSKFKRFGYNFDLSGDFLAVSESQNDQRAYRGGAIHIYRYQEREWRRETSITSSVVGDNLQLGRDVAISENALAAIARPQSSSGTNQDILYVFAKVAGTPWSDAKEVFAGPIDPEVPATDRLEVLGMDFQGETLAVSYQAQAASFTNIYNVTTDGVAKPEATLQTPVDITGAWGQKLRVALGAGSVAIGVPDFQGEDSQSSGQAFVFEKSNNGTWSSEPVAILQPSLPGQQRFGSQVVTVGDRIIVACDYGTENGSFEPKAFVYERPSDGWNGSLQENAVLRTGQTGSYFSTVVLAANTNYVFYGKAIEAAISVFKKTGDNWVDQGRTSLLFSPIPGINFGDRIRSNDRHLVLNLPGDLTGTEFRDEEVYTYEPPAGAFEAVTRHSSRLVATDSSATEDYLGTQMATLGDWMAVSALGDDDFGPNAGAVYLYRRAEPAGDWQLSQVVRSPSSRAYERFGSALHLTDDRLFVSALGFEEGQGIVYSYELAQGGWQFEAQLVSPELNVPGVPIDNSRKGFGRDIAFSGQTLAISQFNTTNTEDRGRVHLFEQSTAGSWQFIGSLRPEAETQFDFFGREMTMNDSLMVVGTGASGTVSGSAMSVYIFRKKLEGWQEATEDARLVTRSGAINDQFGYSIALHDNLIAVGAIRALDDTNTETGAVYLFNQPQRGWSGTVTESATLLPEDPIEAGSFGYEVYMDDRYLLVSAPKADDRVTSLLANAESSVGKVYLFDHSTGSLPIHEISLINAPEGSGAKAFGTVIERSGREILVSAPGASSPVGFFSGAVFAWEQYPYIADLDEAICIDGDAVMLSVSGDPIGTWSGQGIVDGAQGIFDPSGLQEGRYQVTFETEGCSASAIVQVAGKPVITRRSDEIVGLCEGGITILAAAFDRHPARLYWSYRRDAQQPFEFIAGLTGRDTVAVNEPGEYLLEFGNQRCLEATTFLVEIDNEQPPAILSSAPAEIEVCPGSSTTLFVDLGEGITTDFRWLYRPDVELEYVPLSNGPDQSSWVTSNAGEYMVVVANGLCREVANFMVVSPDLESAIQPSDDLVLCENESISLSLEVNQEVDSYEWYFRASDGFVYNEIVGDSSSLTVSTAGSYFCEYSSVGCTVTSDTLDVISPEVTIDLEIATSICSANEMYPLSASPDGGDWFLDGELVTADFLVAGDLANGDYALSYRLERLGCVLEEIATIRVAIADQDMIPDAFTPNGDGINDVFDLGFSGDLSAYEFQVFDRSGSTVFRSREASVPWDGGEEIAGTYFWSLSFVDECQSGQVRRSGTVYLLR